MRIVHNGVSRAEFEPIALEPDATDLMFIGELRDVKGIDVLIEAIALMHRDGRPMTATLVGNGPDRAALRGPGRAQRPRPAVRFMGAMPARQALALGWLMVAP